jgi:hypothetical protein
MRHLLTGVVVAILAGLVLTPSASAITIYDVKAKTLADPEHWYNSGLGNKLGNNTYSLMWNKLTGLDPRDLVSGGRPTGDYTGKWSANPAWFSFKTGSLSNNGSGSYVPSGTLPGEVIPRQYTLSTFADNYQFDFSVLFYDPLLALPDDDLVASVILTGNFGTHAGPTLLTDPFNVKTLRASQVKLGTVVTFNVGVQAAEKVDVTIETKGTYAAGFFMDNVTKGWDPPVYTSLESPPAVTPEPATMALLALGLGSIMMRRRRR